MEQFSLTRENMRILYNVPIEMDDGIVLRANVYQPMKEGAYPVVFSYGIYGKDLAVQEGYPEQWKSMVSDFPEILVGSSSIHQSWEVVDPEKWCCDDYVVVRIDSRGAGNSPGYMDPMSKREQQDIYNCVEWMAEQPWCTGKIGILGISYYACSAWLAAQTQPPHLTAMICWEGHSDIYRECLYHGGILSNFELYWYGRQPRMVQYGLGEKGFKSPVHGLPVSGDVTMTEAELLQNRVDFCQEIRDNPLATAEVHQERITDFSKVKVPFLSAGNWGGQGVHLRGNVEGFMRAASEHKYLEIHDREHWTHFYTNYGLSIQKQFFGYFLKGEENGWEKKDPCQLNIRHVDGTVELRGEKEWPIARTKYVKYYLDPEHLELVTEKPKGTGSLTYNAQEDGITFMTPPLKEEVEITGHSMTRLYVSSATKDADIYLVLRVFTPDMKEVTFRGALDPHTPVSQGWQRVSHRKLDKELSTDFRPFLAHDEIQYVEPGQIVELLTEIQPTCIVVPKGYRIALTIRGKDYVSPGVEPAYPPNRENPLTGCAQILHFDRLSTPLSIYGSDVTLHFDNDKMPYLQLPIIPKKGE